MRYKTNETKPYSNNIYKIKFKFFIFLSKNKKVVTVAHGKLKVPNTEETDQIENILVQHALLFDWIK